MSITAVPLQPTPKRVLWYLWIGIAVAIVAALWLAVSGTAAVRAGRGTNAQFLAWHKGRAGVVTTASGLQYQVVKKGDGTAHPTQTDVALVNYIGKLRSGAVFDQSQRPTPMPVAGVVPGFSEGLKLMTKGSKYRFWIKPELGYGDSSPDPAKLPNNSILVFDVELLDFIPEQVLQQMQQQQMMQQQMQGGAPGAPGAVPPGAAPGAR